MKKIINSTVIASILSILYGCTQQSDQETSTISCLSESVKAEKITINIYDENKTNINDTLTLSLLNSEITDTNIYAKRNIQISSLLLNLLNCLDSNEFKEYNVFKVILKQRSSSVLGITKSVSERYFYYPKEEVFLSRTGCAHIKRFLKYTSNTSDSLYKEVFDNRFIGDSSIKLVKEKMSVIETSMGQIKNYKIKGCRIEYDSSTKDTFILYLVNLFRENGIVYYEIGFSINFNKISFIEFNTSQPYI